MAIRFVVAINHKGFQFEPGETQRSDAVSEELVVLPERRRDRNGDEEHEPHGQHEDGRSPVTSAVGGEAHVSQRGEADPGQPHDAQDHEAVNHSEDAVVVDDRVGDLDEGEREDEVEEELEGPDLSGSRLHGQEASAATRVRFARECVVITVRRLVHA